MTTSRRTMTIEVTVWGSEDFVGSDGDSMGQFFDQQVTPIQPPNGDGGGLGLGICSKKA